MPFPTQSRDYFFTEADCLILTLFSPKRKIMMVKADLHCSQGKNVNIVKALAVIWVLLSTVFYSNPALITLINNI